MTRDEHLMTIGMEECNEVAQRISKALRFGMGQIQQDADDKPEENPERLTNRERIMYEYYHLRAVLGMMGIDAWDTSDRARHCEHEKVKKVERYLWRSASCGTLTQKGEAKPAITSDERCHYKDCNAQWTKERTSGTTIYRLCDQHDKCLFPQIAIGRTEKDR